MASLSQEDIVSCPFQAINDPVISCEHIIQLPRPQVTLGDGLAPVLILDVDRQQLYCRKYMISLFRYLKCT